MTRNVLHANSHSFKGLSRSQRSHRNALTTTIRSSSSQFEQLFYSASGNPHARRARNLAVQAKWDRVVDEVLEHDRRENRERQRAVFTTVSLFLSTFFVALMRPQLWQVFDYAGRAICLTLFVIGVWHLATRLREYLQHYTYMPKPIQYSIMREDEKPEQPFTRFSAYTFLLVGYAVSIGVGLFIGWQTQDFFNDFSLLFQHRVDVAQSNLLMYSSAALVPDLVIYPPIAVLIVDSMQALAHELIDRPRAVFLTAARILLPALSGMYSSPLPEVVKSTANAVRVFARDLKRRRPVVYASIRRSSQAKEQSHG